MKASPALERVLLFAAFWFIIYREAFPASLSNTCDANSYHLNAKTVFLAPTRPIFRAFWASEYAPVCRDEAKEEEETKIEDTTNNSTSSSITLNSVLVWTQSFGVFTNTVVEENVLPRLVPIVAKKYRAAAQTISNSWEPSYIKDHVQDFWTALVKPRIPLSVVHAWEDAFSAPIDNEPVPTNATDSAATPSQEDDDNDDNNVNLVFAFSKFAIASVSSWRHKLIVDASKLVDDLHANVSCTWNGLHYHSKMLLFGLLVVFPIAIVTAFLAYHVVRAHCVRRAEKQAAAAQAVPETWGRLRVLLEKIRALNVVPTFATLADCIFVCLPDDPHFDIFRQYYANKKKSCRSMRVVFLILHNYVFNPNHSLDPQQFTEGQRYLHRFFTYIVYCAAKNDGLLEPVGWDDLGDFIRDADEEAHQKQCAFSLEVLSFLIFNSLPSENTHFKAYCDFYKIHRMETYDMAITLRKLYQELQRAVHTDKVLNLTEYQQKLCGQLSQLINTSYAELKKRQ